MTNPYTNRPHRKGKYQSKDNMKMGIKGETPKKLKALQMKKTNKRAH
jgi:hypothetical protein